MKLLKSFQKSWKKADYQERLGMIVIIGVILLIPFSIIYRFTSSFNKDIVIKEKYVTTKGNNTYYYIVSKKNETYILSNDLYTGQFNKSGLFARLDVGMKYNIKGSGVRIPILGIFPKIHSIN